MNKEIRDKWVKALRSGDYKQGRGVLRNCQDEFCCLGVLCDIAVKEGIIPKPILYNGIYMYSGGNGMFLSKIVKDWAGIHESGIGLTTLNDEMKYDFNRIADLIETENLK